MTNDQHRAKKEVAETLKYFDITKPPVDTEIIARAMGVDVVYANFKPDIDREISGFIRFEPLQIIVNRTINPDQITFTIAHELAH